MTGTSVDGIDAALIEVEGAGLAMHAGFLKGASAPLGSLGSRLREFASNSPQCAEEVAQMAMTLGKIHAEVLRELLGDAEPDLIVLHGQTVFHRPPLSWQLINPWPVAAQFKAEIIIDLRGADLAAGGQGAPITPLADFILFRNDTRARVILNFGGFINYTFIPDGSNFLRSSSQSNEAWLNEVQGGDISPCNQLLDSIVRKSFGMPYDDGGAIAMQGMVDERAQQSLLRRLKHAESATRSLGTGDEAFEWHDEFKGLLEPADILRTACAAIADRVAGVIAKYGDVDVLAAGGGIKNRALMAEIEKRLGQSLKPTDDCGIPSEYREAVEIAILGALASEGIEITLPQITGRGNGVVHGCRIGGRQVIHNQSLLKKPSVVSQQ